MFLRTAVVLPALILCGCAESPRPAPAESPAEVVAPQRVQPEQDGLHNLLRLDERLYSGGEPHGPEAFASLARLGVKTIVSVDGVAPNLAAAREHGLRYVHIPIGYDGISEQAAAALTRAARDCETPIYVHCHHGQHRGPAAAAVVCRAARQISAAQARKILELAGTSADYAGLWRDVENYQPPGKDVELPELVEAAEVDSLAAAMAKLDRHWDRLKLCRDADWQPPAHHPDLIPEQEVLLVKESLQEAHRITTAGEYDERFQAWFAESERQAEELEAAVKRPEDDARSHSLRQLEASCKRCHQAYRN